MSDTLTSTHSALDFVQPPSSVSVESWTRAFAKLRPYVVAVVRKTLHQPSDVDDVVQEVFLALHQQRDDIRDMRCLKGWLSTIARRQSQRHLRKRQRRHEDVLDSLTYPGLRPDARADLHNMLRRLRGLPSEIRKPWMLRYVDGESLPAIAQTCDCSMSTAQRRIRAAAKAMGDRSSRHEPLRPATAAISA